MLLGCIGDDFTGSSDLANTLRKQGMQTVQYCGIPDSDAAPEVEAGVVALKSRSCPASEAIDDSLRALAWLRQQGCQQYFFKYCSTFDSTPEGNIGPVLEALAKELSADRVIVCPAFPGTGRSVYQGHLFVNDVLLNESGMQNHPINPMPDADIRRWLTQQTSLEVGHVGAQQVLQGAQAIRAALQQQHDNGKGAIVVDAIQDADLMDIGSAAADLKLITGGSGVALGLPAVFKSRGLLSEQSDNWHGQQGHCVALSGSCSVATRAQLAQHRKRHPAFELQAGTIIDGTTTIQAVTDWATQALADNGDCIPVIFSSADPAVVAQVQNEFGRERSAETIEQFFSGLAAALVATGIERLLVAGGETSGAAVQGLNLTQLQIGPEIDPGVPALRASNDLVLALKSGNFGAEDFFEKGAVVLTGNHRQ